MTDRLVNLGRRPTARKLAGTLGLNLPPTLARESGPWVERPLQDRDVVVLMATGAALAGPIATTLARAGAGAILNTAAPDFITAGEAFSRPPRVSSTEGQRAHAVVFDATGITSVDGLQELHRLLHPRLRDLRSNGRVVVIGRPHADQDGSEAVAAQRALDGFVRSLAKELGRKGSTANLMVVPEGAEDRLEPVLRFMLSERSAFVSGQPFVLSKSARATDGEWVRPLDGKVALVTGAGRGIGAATAQTLAREGARVIVLDRPEDEELAQGVAAEVGGTPLLVDLAGDDAATTVRDFLSEGVDIVVHNAGVTRDKTLSRMDDERWDTVLDVNLRAVLRLHAAVEDKLRSHARVVCLSSIGGIAGNVGQTNYAASKAAIIGFVQAAAPGLARRGIAINAVAPGFIETRMTAAIPVATREVARRLSNLSQGGLPHDVAEVITFLASPGAAGMTGQTLRVCGGNLVGA